MRAYPSGIADVHSTYIFILWFLGFDFFSVKYSMVLGGSQKTKRSLRFKRRDVF